MGLGIMGRNLPPLRAAGEGARRVCPLKEVSAKGIKPVVGRLPARERRTLLAIARVLAGK